ncbi:hypothetical protein [Armatimonas rosea]|uniref:Uncharacterized protein n=1 Tax=Armatimonas rosea TaxID=685828 RepID=A0A7W9W9J1_ARMRO|nr:hypothetical protein [Armatimonas rosea]MBB6053898.1 hypothetical protein [Armatimonas rosea]
MIKKGGIYTTEFSEFTFGYALTHNIERRLATVTAVPSFPSLREEGGAGGGYDVRLQSGGTPIFVQFKIPRVIRRKNARAPENNFVDPEYFRMYLHHRNTSDQQKLLVELRNRFQNVYYACPEFHTVNVLNRNHINSTTVDATAFFDPVEIGLLQDDDEHYIVYKPNSQSAYFCSNPIEINNISFSQIATSLGDSDIRDMPEEFYNNIILTFINVVTNAGRADLANIISLNIQQFPELAPWYRVSYFSQLIFDSQFFISNYSREVNS